MLLCEEGAVWESSIRAMLDARDRERASKLKKAMLRIDCISLYIQPRMSYPCLTHVAHVQWGRSLHIMT